jgi:flavin reductase (DIM6/NTAB) family NADH-FMN oxidoreductase RutF
MLDEKLFREAMGHFATGVTVVTTSDGAGGLTGFTANAFTSLSLSPPQVLVCLSTGLRSYPILQRAGRFAIHILAEDQVEVARVFATRGADKAGATDWHLSALGNPVLDHYLTLIECDLSQEHAGADHVIVIGQVKGLDIRRGVSGPLVFFRGEMGGLS